jgi:hypothetical protein
MVCSALADAICVTLRWLFDRLARLYKLRGAAIFVVGLF